MRDSDDRNGEEAAAGDPLSAAVDDASASLREWADALRSSLAAASTGTYTAKRLSDDVAAAGARAVRDWALALSNTIKIAGSFARAAAPVGPDEPPPPPPPPEDPKDR
jgi:hypothetical protein